MLITKWYRGMICSFAVLHFLPCISSFMAVFAASDAGALYGFVTMFTLAILWWLSYDRLQKSLKGGLALSFVLVSFDWLLVCAYLIHAVLFVNKSSIDVVDPPSSPMAAIIGITGGLFWSIPLSIMMAMGILEILRVRCENRNPSPITE